MASRVDPIFSLRLLVQSLVGVLVGVLVALLLADLFWPVGGRLSVMPDELLAWNLHNVLFKPREKGFYLLSLLLGVMSGYVVICKLYHSRLFPLIVCLIATIPVLMFLCAGILQKNITLYFLIAFLTLWAVVITNILKNHLQKFTAVSVEQTPFFFPVIPYLFLLGIMFLLLLPVSFTLLAARIGMEIHVVSFIIGPALYFLGGDLLPGLDYYTQYSLGMGWLFSHFMGASIDQTYVNYMRFVITAVWFFYAEMLALLIWLYRSWVPAALVVSLSLIMLFHTHAHFFDPSSSILRYPLMGVCATCLAAWNYAPRVIWRHLALAVSLALSVFLNTETGIIFSAAVVFACLFTGKSLYASFIQLSILGITSLIILISILYFVFGPGVLHVEFYKKLAEPLLIFGKIGFGGWPINWSMSDLNWFYNIVAPGIAIATIALVIRAAQSRNADVPRLAVLVFFCVSGLLMLAKYINMSIMGVWQVNSLGLLVPLAWWGRVFYLRLESIRVRIFKHSVSAPSLVFLASVLGAFWLGALTSDVRNPSEYGLQSWIKYPSLIREFIRPTQGCNDFTCVDHLPAERDIALIRDRTREGEPVAIIDQYDWVYLVNAHRPPQMSFLPSTVIFTKKQLQDSLKRLEHTPYLFLHKNKDKDKPYIPHPPQLREALMPDFLKYYVWEAEGEELVAWRRKDLQVKS